MKENIDLKKIKLPVLLYGEGSFFCDNSIHFSTASSSAVIVFRTTNWPCNIRIWYRLINRSLIAKVMGGSIYDMIIKSFRIVYGFICFICCIMEYDIFDIFGFPFSAIKELFLRVIILWLLFWIKVYDFWNTSTFI